MAPFHGIHTALVLAGLSTAILPVASVAQVVLPTVETDPSHHAGDTADDVAIWIHPTDTSWSLVIGDDKNGGLMVYGLDGRELQYVDGTNYSNLDLRYNFPLAGTFSGGSSHQTVALVGVGDELEKQLDFFKVNPATRRLESAGSITTGIVPYGACMYHSPVSNRFYYFVNAPSGVTQQWELRDGGGGNVTGTLVRQFDVGTRTEGCVADDVLARFYIGEENVAVWRYDAEPGAGATGVPRCRIELAAETRVQVDNTGAGGHLTADVEGMSLYYTRDGSGYLIVSSQGSSTFAVYSRDGNNTFLGTFSVAPNGTIDSVSSTDGLDVTNFPLAGGFSQGLLVVHDASNSGGTASNYKYVPWESIAGALGLRIDTSWDPRLIGGIVGVPPGPDGGGIDLGRPHPNPTSGGTTLRLILPHPIEVAATVRDLKGRLVRRLVSSGSRWRAGPGSIHWDGRSEQGTDLPTGIYFLRVRVGRYLYERSVIVLR